MYLETCRCSMYLETCRCSMYLETCRCSMYLETCRCSISVTNVTHEFCQQNNELIVHATSSGYVASLVTSDHPLCARHPWIIEAASAQRINLTLYDFTVDARSGVSGGGATVVGVDTAPKKSLRANSMLGGGGGSGGSGGGGTGDGCRQYAVVADGERKFTICGSNRRNGGSYLSRANRVRLWITAGIAPTDMQRFIIQYSGLVTVHHPILRFGNGPSSNTQV